jgi:uncharacterized repeat protein (TIGR01451 family)
MILRRLLVATAIVAGATAPVMLVGGDVSAPDAVKAAGLPAPDTSTSAITQDLVDRTKLPGTGWELVIEATLDSNTVCHVLLFQCVVEPQLAPANMTLVSVECLSPRWANIQIFMPPEGRVVDVCARFDGRRAGHDQKFRFTYHTTVDTGTVSERVEFFRFPEEIFFIRAQHTITIDLGNAADVLIDCPDTAQVGTNVVCSVRLDVHAAINETVGVTSQPPLEFTPASSTLTPPAGGWTVCGPAGVLTCTWAAPPLPAGTYTFSATSLVASGDGPVETCAQASSAAVLNPPIQDCDTVQIFSPSDTSLDLGVTAASTRLLAGEPVTLSITVDNTGPNPAQTLRLFQTPPVGLVDLVVRSVGGGGTWTCTSTASLLECASATLPVGLATFEVTGRVSPDARPGNILSEWDLTAANDVFAPEPVRAGVVLTVLGLTFTG